MLVKHHGLLHYSRRLWLPAGYSPQTKRKMSLVKLTDKGGASITTLKLEDRYLPAVVRLDEWNSILNMNSTKDDVITCVYPKSGTHWVWEIATMLRRGDSSPVPEQMGQYSLDFHHFSFFDHYTSRVFTSHRYYHELPIAARNQRCKMIVVLRDPRDIAVSYFNMVTHVKPAGYGDGRFENFLHLYLDGEVAYNSWWQHILNWSKAMMDNPDQPFLVIHYEDMKEDPSLQTRRIAEFLQVGASDELIESIVTNTSFDSMKSHKGSSTFMGLDDFKDSKSFFFRKGVVGDWTNWFSEEQAEYTQYYLRDKLSAAHLGPLESVKRYLV